jgi:hypothetical protein
VQEEQVRQLKMREGTVEYVEAYTVELELETSASSKEIQRKRLLFSFFFCDQA